MRRFLVNTLVVMTVVAGGAAVVVGLVFKSGPTTTPSATIVSQLKPLPSSSTVPPPPPPIDIPSGIPRTLTVQGPTGMLIDHVKVDPNQLLDNGHGVVPGDDPGLFVKPGTSVL